jgi:acetyltransferase
VYRDRALALPPLNTKLASRLLEPTRVYKALQGIRGRASVDLAALETLLVRFSELVVEQPRIREIDINPLLASTDQLLALDARIVLFGSEVEEVALRRPAIWPYPAQYISRWKMNDGCEAVIRPIRPEDEPLMGEFHGALSDSTVYLRYFHRRTLNSRVAHERLVRSSFIDYDREMVLVADRTDLQSGRHELLGVGRLTRQRSPDDAELGLPVTDRCQGAGLGTELVRRLIEVARNEKVRRVIAHILSGRQAMLKLATRFHFSVNRDEDPVFLLAILDLDGRVSVL